MSYWGHTLEPGLAQGLVSNCPVTHPFPIGCPVRISRNDLLYMGLPSCGTTKFKMDRTGRVPSAMGRSQRRGPLHRPWCSDYGLSQLVLGTWQVTSLEGKQPQIVYEAERYQLVIVRLISLHDVGYGTNLLFTHRKRHQVGVTLLIACQLGSCVLTLYW